MKVMGGVIDNVPGCCVGLEGQKVVAVDQHVLGAALQLKTPERNSYCHRIAEYHHSFILIYRTEET